MQFFRGQHRKALREVKPHLMAENRARADARPVAALHAIIKNALEKVKIVPHERIFHDSSWATQRILAKHYDFTVKNAIYLPSACRLWRYTGFVINPSDPGAVPGASTILFPANLPAFGGRTRIDEGVKVVSVARHGTHRYRAILIVANDNYAEVAVAA